MYWRNSPLHNNTLGKEVAHYPSAPSSLNVLPTKHVHYKTTDSFLPHYSKTPQKSTNIKQFNLISKQTRQIELSRLHSWNTIKKYINAAINWICHTVTFFIMKVKHTTHVISDTVERQAVFFGEEIVEIYHLPYSNFTYRAGNTAVF